MDAAARTTELRDLLGARARLGPRLPGGAHAATYLVEVDGAELVARWFPVGDPALTRELEVLRVLAAPDPIPLAVPETVGHAGSLLVTTRVPGGPPPPDADPRRLAVPLARALAVIHAHDPGTLPVRDPVGSHAQAAYARGSRESGLEAPAPAALNAPPVLSHGDSWCGNALWTGGDEPQLTGVVDWSGAHRAPRGADLAWGRQDLALLGSVAAAELLAAEYCRLTGFDPADVHAWDVQATWRAWGRVGSWAANYAGIGRADLTASTLEDHFDRWVAHLRGAGP